MGRSLSFSARISPAKLLRPPKAAPEGLAVTWEETEDTMATASNQRLQAPFSAKIQRQPSFLSNRWRRSVSRLRFELNFWRPPINNDEGAKLPFKLSAWYDVARQGQVQGSGNLEDGRHLHFDLNLGVGKSDATIDYYFQKNGWPTGSGSSTSMLASRP